MVAASDVVPELTVDAKNGVWKCLSTVFTKRDVKGTVRNTAVVCDVGRHVAGDTVQGRVAGEAGVVQRGTMIASRRGRVYHIGKVAGRTAGLCTGVTLTEDGITPKAEVRSRVEFTAVATGRT